MSQDFFKSLAKKTEHRPSRGTDQRILQRAEKVLVKSSRPWGKWIIAVGTPVAVVLMIWIQPGTPRLPQAMLAESPELIRNFEDIELWSEISDLSEAELRYLETGKS